MPIELKGEKVDGQIYVCDTNQEMIIEIPNTIIDQESDEQWHQSQALAYTTQAPNIITYYGSSEKKSQEMCSSYSLILGYYEFVPHNVQKEINSRKYNQEGFGEKEVWYLLWVIASALYELKQRGYNHKDLRPQTIGLKKNGVIKLCPVGLLPHQKNSVARFLLENQQGYLPPTLKQQLIQGAVPSIKWNKVDAFALGNTLLDLMLLEVPVIVEQNQIAQLCSHCYSRYSTQIVKITEGLMQENDEQIKIEELYLLLKPYSEKIMNLQEFQINFEDIKRSSIPLDSMSKLRLKFIIDSFISQNNGQQNINEYHQENHRPQSEIIYESHLQRDTTYQQHQVNQIQQNIEIQQKFSNQQSNQGEQINQQNYQIQNQIQFHAQQEQEAQQNIIEQRQFALQQQQQFFQQQYQQKVLNSSQEDQLLYQQQNLQPQQTYIQQPQQNIQQIQQAQFRGAELRQSVSPQPRMIQQPQPQLLQRLLVQSQQVIPSQQQQLPVPVAITPIQNSPIDQIKYQQQIPQQQQYLSPPPPQIQQSTPLPMQNQQVKKSQMPAQQLFQPPQQIIAQPVQGQQQIQQPPPPQLIQRIVKPAQQSQPPIPQQVPVVIQQPTIGYQIPQQVNQNQPIFKIMPQAQLSPIGPRVPIQLTQTISPIDDTHDREVTVLEYKPTYPNQQILKASNRPFQQIQNPRQVQCNIFQGDNFDRIRNVLQSSDELLQYNK